MQYGLVLLTEEDGVLPLRREMVQSDSELARTVLAGMRECGIPLPPPQQVFPNRSILQGNLSEFCVLELGEKHWRLYRRQLSWPANKDPWRPSSDPGIDILAVDDSVSILMVIEVKSSEGDGSSLVTSESRGLKGDFDRLFKESNLRTRLLTRALDVAYDLRFQQGRPDLADKVGTLVGTSPATSPGVRLIGVLVCSCSEKESHDKRRRAFQVLHSWLTQEDGDQEQQWEAKQCRYYTVELGSVPAWVDHLRRGL